MSVRPVTRVIFLGLHRLLASNDELGISIEVDEMEVGKIYNVAFLLGRYDLDYENQVQCIKVTPKNFRVRRADGSTRLIRQDYILKLELVSSLA